jgi:hypothetical protein
MRISQNFHMSQVHGVRRKKPEKQPTRDWRLTETEDFQRSCILGNMRNTSSLSSLRASDSNVSSLLRRRFLLGRTMCCSKNSRRELRLVSHGRMSLLLRSMESPSPLLIGKAVPSGAFRKPSEAAIDVLFPVATRGNISTALTSSICAQASDAVDSISKSISGQISPPVRGFDVTADVVRFEEMNHFDDCDPPLVEPFDPGDIRPSSPKKPLDLIEGFDEFRLPSQCDSSAAESDACREDEPGAATKNDDTMNDSFCLPSPTSDDDSFNVPDDDAAGDAADIEESDALVDVEGDDEFRLPTPDSSSDEEEEDVDPDTISTQSAANVSRTSKAGELFPLSLPTRAPVNQEHSPCLEMAGSKVAFSNGDSPQSVALCVKKKSNKRRLVIEDTPETPAATDGKENCSNLAILDATNCVGGLENSVCAICLTNEVSEVNPLILCDGLKLGVQCNLTVHCRCYSVRLDGLDVDAEWRCDPCQHLFLGGSPSKIQCSSCDRLDGILKRLENDEWKHMECLSILPKLRNPLKRLRRVTAPEPPKHADAANLRRPLEDVLPTNQLSPAELAKEKKRRRQLVMQQYMDYEAEASDTGDEEEELAVLDIEEEELDHGDFINDSSQLGFTQDDLDRVEPVDYGCDASHRALDVERERKLQFATPILNRRMQRNGENDEDLLRSSASAPDSVRGLGKMHFIRSVLEHHRHGGSAAEVEDFYKEIEEQAENESSPVGDEW